MVESTLLGANDTQQSIENDTFLVQCVQSQGKLRMRIINSVKYSNLLNCQAPKSIRKAGVIYRLKTPKVTVRQQGSSTFYKLPNNISLYDQVQLDASQQLIVQQNWLTTQQLKEMGISIFPEPVCCICLDADATVLLVPCYHKQFCKGCIQSQENTQSYYSWQKKKNTCCICRQPYSKYYEIIE